MTKVFCKGQHLEVKDGQLLLDTPEGQEVAKQVITTLEAQIRLRIYDEICAIPLIQDRKKLVKLGIENVALMVQDACAQVVIKDSQK